MDLDLRRVRYFVEVAERLHFGRAAAVLHMTQPALSRQVRQLEDELGVKLLDRSSRHVALTTAGKKLAEDGAELLAASKAAIQRARRGNPDGPSLTLGFMLGMDLSQILNEFSRVEPEVDIQLQRLRWWNHADAVRDGRVDVGLVRRPLAQDGLIVQSLYNEPICVTLPATHPLAGEASVRIADLAHEPVLVYADADPAWNAFWTIDPRPDGSHPPGGTEVHDMEEILAYARTGKGVAFLPKPIVEGVVPRDVVFVSVADVPDGEVVLATSSEKTPPYVPTFVDAAKRAVGGRR
ncbi:MAG TPA: LysR family transcriptional regulator [Acidimicrobiales bacterium]